MQYKYPQSRYNLLCAMLNISNDKIQTHTRNKEEKGKQKKKVFSNNLSMNNMKEIPKDVPHLQGALKKAYNEIAYLKNSKKEMRLNFEVRLSLYHKKYDQNKKSNDNEFQAIKTNLQNLLIDISDVYLLEKSSKKCTNDDCDWNRNIRYLLQKYEHVPNLYENYQMEFKKYYTAVKPIVNNSLIKSKDISKNEYPIIKLKENKDATIMELTNDFNEVKFSSSQKNKYDINDLNKKQGKTKLKTSLLIK